MGKMEREGYKGRKDLREGLGDGPDEEETGEDLDEGGEWVGADDAQYCMDDFEHGERLHDRQSDVYDFK